MSEAALVPDRQGRGQSESAGAAARWKAASRSVLKASGKVTSRSRMASSPTSGSRFAHPLGRAQKAVQPVFADQAIQ